MLFIREELTVAVIRKVKTARGTEDRDITQPTLSYPDTDLPRVIVEVWNNRGHILDRDPDSNIPTKQAVDEATELINRETGMALRRAVIITEEEHDNHYTMQDDDEIVFVLPNLSRIIKGSSQHQLLRVLPSC